jgi:hypothetical protein
MRICIVWLLLAFAVLVGTAQSQEIVDLYSGIDSSDVTIDGDVAGYTLRLDLILDRKVILTQDIKLNGPGVWIARWSPNNPEKGSYNICATLQKDGIVVSKKCDAFFYGGIQPLRFNVRDFYADSRGMHLSMSTSDPTIVDIYYMLIEGNKAVYVTNEKAVSIAGSYAATVQKDYEWKQILETNKEYTGRVKIVELNHNQTMAFMNSFRALDDALITETYQDETGASATVAGNSRVPFEGYLQFVLSQKGVLLNITEKKTPVLLTGDDETVEISWNNILSPGIYQLRTVLIGQGGVIKDLKENVIEAKPIVKNNATETEKKAPLPPSIVTAALFVIALLLKRRRRLLPLAS